MFSSLPCISVFLVDLREFYKRKNVPMTSFNPRPVNVLFCNVQLVMCKLLQAVGEVVSTGSQCKRSHAGQAVAYMYFGAFSEYLVC